MKAGNRRQELGTTKRAAVTVWLVAILSATTISTDVHAAAKTYRIGLLANTVSNRPVELKPLTSRLSDLGYVDGQHFTVEERYWEGKVERLPALGDELVGLRCDVIVTSGTESANAAQKATKTIPIVVAFGPDFLRLGLVKELSHPGGNITGMTSIGAELYGKKLELLKEALPKLSKIAFILEIDESQRRPNERRGNPSAGSATWYAIL